MQIESVDTFIDGALKSESAENAAKLTKILYGEKPQEVVEKEALKLATELNCDLEIHSFEKVPLQCQSPRMVRIAGIQMQYPGDPAASVQDQMKAVHKRVHDLLELCGQAKINIVCLQETWPMPFAFCTREKLPWTEFAESAETGPSFQVVSKQAAKHHMVVVSPILERDEGSKVIWNTAVVIDENGNFLGKTRKNHIPRVGDFNESTYYMESSLGHPVFKTKFGTIAVNICYGRHHPLNWLMYGLHGAEIVFNPSATIDTLSETLWGVEARNAAIANNYFVVGINRVGTEVFPREFTSGDGKPAHRHFGHFFGSSYITDPEGSRTPYLSRIRDGIVAADIDLNKIISTRDHWGFQMTARLDLYANALNNHVKKLKLNHPYPL